MKLFKEYIQLILKETDDYDGVPDQVQALAEGLYDELLSMNDFHFTDLKLEDLIDRITDDERYNGKSAVFRIRDLTNYKSKSTYKNLNFNLPLNVSIIGFDDGEVTISFYGSVNNGLRRHHIGSDQNYSLEESNQDIIKKVLNTLITKLEKIIEKLG